MKLTVSSTAFEEYGTIPSKYTCDGLDISPPLAWAGAPEQVGSWTVTCLDPDAPAGTWTHWIVFNLPSVLSRLDEGLTPLNLPSGSAFGANSWGANEYGGPCPPSGTHRYFFTVYGLDGKLDLTTGAPLKNLAEAMEGRILAEGSLMGKYSRD